MQRYFGHYSSPLGGILLAADEVGLFGLWFEGQKHFPSCVDGERDEGRHPVLPLARRWLDVYFSGREPDFSVPLRLLGTEFQTSVWEILRTIPYGGTATYGRVAGRLARGAGKPGVSARAVGGAIARNAVSIIVPCHRVIGADGSLTGYAGGIERKAALLALEGAMPERRDALRGEK